MCLTYSVIFFAFDRGNHSHPLKFNEIDGKVDRTSYPNSYKIDQQGLPLNPRGRTGITGRGRLGRWGPNHAGDPIVTRFVVLSRNQYTFLIEIQMYRDE